MKNVMILGSVLALALATTGCKSEIEKFADSVCDCKDKKCVEELEKAMKEKYKGEKADELFKNMSDKDKEAIKRGQECEDKIK